MYSRYRVGQYDKCVKFDFNDIDEQFLRKTIIVPDMDQLCLTQNFRFGSIYQL